MVLFSLFAAMLSRSLHLFVSLSLSLSRHSLSSVPEERDRVSIPAGDSSVISACSFLGHHMKGGMEQAEDAVDVCLCKLNMCVRGCVTLCDAL